MEYSLEKTCLFCRHFLKCRTRSRSGTCSDWKEELYAGSLLETLKFDDIVLESDHPDCLPYKDKARREKEEIQRYMHQFQTNRLNILANGLSELETFMPSEPKSIKRG